MSRLDYAGTLCLDIVKGKPFNPVVRMKKIQVDAAKNDAVTFCAIAFRICEKSANIYPDSAC